MQGIGSKSRILRLSESDNGVVAVDRIEAGERADDGIVAAERIPFGHKMAIGRIAAGEPVMKLGQIIGFATQPIEAGAWVHVHNVEMHDFDRDYRFGEAAEPAASFSSTLFCPASAPMRQNRSD